MVAPLEWTQREQEAQRAFERRNLDVGHRVHGAMEAATSLHYLVDLDAQLVSDPPKREVLGHACDMVDRSLDGRRP
jgi:hypothetical protein